LHCIKISAQSKLNRFFYAKQSLQAILIPVYT